MPMRPGTPEYRVRQRVLHWLQSERGYPLSRVRLDVAVTIGSRRGEADAVLYENDALTVPYAVIETKAPAQHKGLDQGISYAAAMTPRPRYVLWSNGTDYTGWDMDLNEEIASIPPAYRRGPLRIYGNGIGRPLEAIRDASQFARLMARCHAVLRNVDRKTMDKAFEAISRLLYTRIWDEMNTPDAEFYAFSAGPSETIRMVAERIRSLYTVARMQEPDLFPVEIGITEDRTLFDIAILLGPWSLLETDLEVKGEAYQRFLDVRLRGEWGQYFTPRNIVRAMVQIVSPTENQKILDPACGSAGFLVYALYHVHQRLVAGYSTRPALLQRHLYDFAHYNLYGLDIDERIAQVAFSNMILNEDAHSHIFVGDALESLTYLERNYGIKPGMFQVILTNPPLGIRENKRRILDNFTTGSGQAEQMGHVLFLERCLELLGPGGMLCTIISEDVLERMPDILQFIRDRAHIRAIISLTRDAFKAYGPNVKTSILLIQKHGPDVPPGDVVLMAEAKNVGYDKAGRTVSANDFPAVVDEWRVFWKLLLEGKRPDARVISMEPLMLYHPDERALKRADVKFAFYTVLMDHMDALRQRWATEKMAIKTVGDVAQVTGLVLETEPDRFYEFASIHFDGTASLKIARTRYKELNVLHAGDLVTSRIDFINGAVAVVPPELDGAVVSKEFFVLHPDPLQIEPLYLWLMLRSEYAATMLEGQMTGVTGRHRIKLEQLLALEIPIPPLERQREIVTLLQQAQSLEREAATRLETAILRGDDLIGLRTIFEPLERRHTDTPCRPQTH